MNIVQLNAQLQRFPTPMLVQIGKQFGIQLNVSQIERIKVLFKENIHKMSTLQDVEAILNTELNPQMSKKLLQLLQQYFQ